MPFLPYSLDEKKKQDELQNTYNVSGSSSNTFTNQNDVSKPVSKSGSWTNLNSYLDANKDNATSMSDKVTSNIENKGNEATSSLNKIPNIDKVSTVDYDKLNNDYYNNVNAKKEDYTNLKQTGGYNGPTDIYNVNGYQDAANKTQKANQTLDMSKTEDGRKTLLKSSYERPNYSLGMQNLDNLLVQNDPTSRSKFQNVQSKYSNLLGLLDDKTNTLNSSIDFNKKSSLENKKTVIAGEEKAKQALLNPINQRVEQMKKDVPLLQSRINTDANDNILNDETLAQLGLSEGQSLYDLALNNYVTPQQASGINAGSISTKDEKAKYKSLMDLIDGVDTLDTGADQFNAINFNKDQFNKDVASKQTEYQTKKDALDQEEASIANNNATMINYWRNAGFGDRADAFFGDVRARKAALEKEFNINRKVIKG